MAGVTTLPTDFSVITAGQIPVNSYLYGFDKNNNNLFSKMDSNLVLTVMEFNNTDFIIPVTYAQLVTLQAGSLLIPGQEYKITDYQTKHFIVDNAAPPVQDVSSIITGSVEPLIVIAVSTNKLDKEAKSTLFPQDVIYYDLLPANWLNDLSFANIAGPTIITGFKGVIYYRHDTLLDNYTGYDFRNCKFRRWQTNTTAWSAIVFSQGSIVNHSGFIYIAIHDSTGGDVPGVSGDIWAQLLDLSLFAYYNGNSTSQSGIPSNAALHNDFLTFVENGTHGIYANVRGNHIGYYKDTLGSGGSGVGSNTILSNNVFVLSDLDAVNMIQNTIGANSYGNTILTSGGGEGFSENEIGDSFQRNIISTDAQANQIAQQFQNNVMADSFQLNTIAMSCQNNFMSVLFKENSVSIFFTFNVIGNTCVRNSILGTEFENNFISQSFIGNICGNSFSNNNLLGGFSSNTISAGFNGNLVGTNCGGNVFGTNFQSNTMTTQFQHNSISDSIISIDFTGATHVYNNYSKYMSRRSVDQVAVLTYIDNANTQHIVLATA